MHKGVPRCVCCGWVWEWGGGICDTCITNSIISDECKFYIIDYLQIHYLDQCGHAKNETLCMCNISIIEQAPCMVALIYID